VTRDFNRLLQKKGDSVIAFYARFSKEWKLYALVYKMAIKTAETEVLYFLQRL